MSDTNLLPQQVVNGPGSDDGDVLDMETPSGVLSPIVPNAEGMTAAEIDMVTRCVNVLNNRSTNNRRRWEYYFGKNIMRNLGLAFPHGNMIARRIHPVCGWAAKAVDMLAARSSLDYFTMPDGVDDTALRKAYDDNDLEGTYQSIVIDELVCGVEFMTVTSGIKGWDEGDIFIGTHSALDAACVWDPRRRRIAYGITVSDADQNGVPRTLNLFTDNAIYTYSRVGDDDVWTRTVVHNPLGRPAMEPLVYRPSDIQPLGRSRVTRSVMSIVDNAVREVMRSEVAAETYTVPQRVLLNVDPAKIKADSKEWNNYWHSYMAVGSDGRGNAATAQQLNPPGMQDHILYMRELAMQMAGETHIPPTSLGVIQDNPSSAEAIYAAKEDLIIEAERMNARNGRALRNVALMVLALSKGCKVSELTEEELGIRAKFRAEDRPSQVTASQAILQQVQAIPRIGETDVALEELGYDDGQIERMHSAWDRSAGEELIRSIVEGGAPTLSAPPGTIQAQEAGAEGHDHGGDDEQR